MRILLLGGSGFIGKNLVNEFLKQKNDVIVFDKFNSFRKTENSNFKFINGEFDDIEKNSQAILEGVDVVIHLITGIIPSNRDEEDIIKEIEFNLLNTIRFLKVMKKSNVKKIVFFSSGGTVYGESYNKKLKETDSTNPINNYGWIKYSMEKYIEMYCRQEGIQYLILRPSNPYGRYQNINGKQGLVAVVAGKILKNEEVTIYGDGLAVRDYIYIEDLSSILIKLIKTEKWNEVYNIGSGKGYLVIDILNIMEKITNINVLKEFREGNKNFVETNVLDISKLENVVGKIDFTPIETGIKKTWEWVKKEFGGDLDENFCSHTLL